VQHHGAEQHVGCTSARQQKQKRIEVGQTEDGGSEGRIKKVEIADGSTVNITKIDMRIGLAGE
jgi:hypothetical protein